MRMPFLVPVLIAIVMVTGCTATAPYIPGAQQPLSLNQQAQFENNGYAFDAGIDKIDIQDAQTIVVTLTIVNTGTQGLTLSAMPSLNDPVGEAYPGQAIFLARSHPITSLPRKGPSPFPWVPSTSSVRDRPSQSGSRVPHGSVRDHMEHRSHQPAEINCTWMQDRQKKGLQRRIVTERFPAPHLVEHHRVHLLVIGGARPHNDPADSAVDDHLGTQEAWPDLREVPGGDIEPREVKGASRASFPAWSIAFISA